MHNVDLYDFFIHLITNDLLSLFRFSFMKKENILKMFMKVN